MFELIYVEDAVRDHPRTQSILSRYPRSRVIPCSRYGEVFNRNAQDFRLQKQRPALILAEKHGETVLETPRGYGIGTDKNYYFSHLLNCVYDCRYCFLQGMYRSAHLVLFVNYELFFEGLEEVLEENLLLEMSLIPVGEGRRKSSLDVVAPDGTKEPLEIVMICLTMMGVKTQLICGLHQMGQKCTKCTHTI